MAGRNRAATICRKGGRRIAAFALAGVLALGMVPAAGFAPQQAYADDEAAAELDAVIPITGGGFIGENGTYKIVAGSTGVITVGENLTPTIIGGGEGCVFKGLSIKIGSNSKVTIRDFWANQASSNTMSTIEFADYGTLNIEGTNRIDNDGGNGSGSLNAAVIHVPYGGEVHLTGTGTFYGYKSALCAYIGGNEHEANGKIVIDSGYWFLKGTKTGPIIGGDSDSVKGGDVVINGGELYLKGVARGALIGGSNEGKSGDVYITGGLVELFEDFTGPAIGAGNSDNAGKLVVTGGSLKTVESSNSHNQKGDAATFKGMPSVSWGAVKATNADDYALLAVDASKYIQDLSKDTVTVKVDGKVFYSGRAYTYVTNEVKNPKAVDTEGALCDTAANWLENDVSWLVTEDNYGENAYPDKSGSSLVPEKNLYLALSKENHVVTVGDDEYIYRWNVETRAFELADVEGATELAGEGRYQTMEKIVRTAYPETAEGVIVATGENFPDALAASSLAGLKDWPVVLTESSALSSEAQKLITDLQAKEAIVIGGENAVSAAAYDSIVAAIGDESAVTRLAGAGRYETADLIYAQGFASDELAPAEEGQAETWSKTAIIATGRNFADALSISGYAFFADAPIFLVDENGEFTDEAKENLEEGGFENVIIVGGTAVVPSSTEQWIDDYIAPEITRLAGDNRYETSAQIAAYAKAQGMTVDGACIATGANFPDALAGGALAGKKAVVTLLACEDNTSAIDAVLAAAKGLTKLVYLGGKSALPQSVRDAAEAAAGFTK